VGSCLKFATSAIYIILFYLFGFPKFMLRYFVNCASEQSATHRLERPSVNTF